MAPPLLPAPAPAPRRRGTRSIIHYDIKPMQFAEEQKLFEQNREQYYVRDNNCNEPWFSNSHHKPVHFSLSSDFPSVPTFAWDWDSNLDYDTNITDSKLEFTATYSQPHSPPANNAVESARSKTSCSSPQLSPVPKLESPILPTVDLSKTQTANAQAVFGYLHMSTPDASISKGISFQQPSQKQFGDPFHCVQHQHKDSFSDLTSLLQLDAPWAF